MKKTYFFSDVHFGLQTKAQEQAKLETMLRLCEEIGREGERLLMVGDIFDYWMEYKHAVPKGHIRFLSALDSLVRAGVEVTYFAGNHDFYLGKYFTEELGISVHYGELETEIGGKKFYICHGDGVGKGDTGYKLFRSLVRNDFNLAWFRWLHPDFGLGLMAHLSQLSRKHTYIEKDYGEAERIFVYANELAPEKKFDYFVCGHRHIVKLSPLTSRPQSYYVNLGTWIGGTPTYAVFDGHELQIRNAKTRELVFAEPAAATAETLLETVMNRRTTA